MRHKKILLVEDNTDMRRAVAEYLQDAGFYVAEAASAEEALSKELYTDASLALLDISLPGASGLDLTKRLKAVGYTGPIIGVTARDSIDDKIIGLETGMTDYIVKPFDLRELLARIQTHLRTSGDPHDMAPLTTTHFRLEPRRHKFFCDDVECKLTLVEFRLMRTLMQNNHVTVTTQDLIEAAWGEGAALDSPPLRIHISNLRSKINDTDLTTILTQPGVGYMLQD